MYRYIFSRLAKVIVLSNTWKETVCKSIGINNVEVIYNPCTTVINEKRYSKQKNILYAGDIDELASCMERLIKDKELYGKIQMASIHFAEEEFSINEINRQIGELYKTLL